MMNPITCVCVLMAAGSGLYLFEEKQQVQLLDRQIEHVLHAADAAHARAGMLRAEYALLNDPSRLQELARQHLPTLVNTVPTQFASLVELDRRLSTVGGSAVAESAPLEAAAPLAKLSPAVAPVLASIPAAPVRAVPVQATLVQTVSTSAAYHVAAPAPRTAFRMVPTHVAPPVIGAAPPPWTVAAVQPPAPAHAARIASRAPAQRTAIRQPANQRLALAYRGDPYATQPATAAEAIGRIARGAPVDAGSPMVASALGMARSIMASGPVASAAAAPFYSGAAQSR